MAQHKSPDKEGAPRERSDVPAAENKSDDVVEGHPHMKPAEGQHMAGESPIAPTDGTLPRPPVPTDVAEVKLNTDVEPGAAAVTEHHLANPLGGHLQTEAEIRENLPR
jgi:hypothetical protein